MGKSKRTRPKSSGDSRQRRIVVLFADIVGASEVSNHKTLEQYNAFLGEFHSVFMEVTKDHKATWYKEHEQRYFNSSVRGDEGCVMILVPGRADLAADVDVAVNIGLDLKRRWLLSQDNANRIRKTGLLPTDLAIGINVGKAYINDSPDGPFVYRPEGYAINLTKRIESASRAGQFTRVFVSEAARGELHFLRDEVTYTFAPQRSINPKGISRDIRVYEVKHHFLATDWSYYKEITRRTRAADFAPGAAEVGLARLAYQANPTNLWLAQEYMMLDMQYERARLEKKKNEGDKPEARKVYARAAQVCRRFATGELRDAGILAIAGFIAGESNNFTEEQRFYREAMDIDRYHPELHWYMAYSMSAELCVALDGEGNGDCEYQDLEPEQRAGVDEIFKFFETAIELQPQHSWMQYDLACELSRWGHVERAISKLRGAIGLNPSIRKVLMKEPYLARIRGDKRVKALMAPPNEDAS